MASFPSSSMPRMAPRSSRISSSNQHRSPPQSILNEDQIKQSPSPVGIERHPVDKPSNGDTMNSQLLESHQSAYRIVANSSPAVAGGAPILNKPLFKHSIPGPNGRIPSSPPPSILSEFVQDDLILKQSRFELKYSATTQVDPNIGVSPKDTRKDPAPLDLNESIHALKEFLPTSLIKTLDQISNGSVELPGTPGPSPTRGTLGLDDLFDCEQLLSSTLYADESHSSDVEPADHHTPPDAFESSESRGFSVPVSMVDSWGLPTTPYLRQNIDTSIDRHASQRIIDRQDSSISSYDLDRSVSRSMSSEIPDLLASSARHPMATKSPDAARRSTSPSMVQSGTNSNSSLHRPPSARHQLSASAHQSHNGPLSTPRQEQPLPSAHKGMATPKQASLITSTPSSPTPSAPERRDASPITSQMAYQIRHDFIDPPLLKPDARAREKEKPKAATFYDLERAHWPVFAARAKLGKESGLLSHYQITMMASEEIAQKYPGPNGQICNASKGWATNVARRHGIVNGDLTVYKGAPGVYEGFLSYLETYHPSLLRPAPGS